jgi:hypothetical protein
MKLSKFGLILSSSYLGLFLAAGLYAIYLLVFHTATSEFCGLPAIFVTLPWSMLLMPIINGLGIVRWYEQFAGTPALYGFWAMMTLLPSALINAAILYTAGHYWECSMRCSDPKKTRPNK